MEDFRDFRPAGSRGISRTRRAGIRGVVALAALMLAGCNTNDALLPPEDLTAAQNSTPVTQAETARIAATQPVATYNNQPLPPPQNTLEAQAQALSSGAAVSPAASPPVGGMAQAPAGQASLAPPSAAGTGTVRFLPIIGAPVQSVTPLSRQLGAAARASGLTIKSSADASAEHMLKGYLSAYTDGGKTVVVYVWDVLDGSGNRLHRIQGQETAPASKGDPWATVPASTMQTIGDKTISAYRQWLTNRSG